MAARQRRTGHGAVVARQGAIGVARVGTRRPSARCHATRPAVPSLASAAHERIRQLVDQNRQPMRRTGIPTSNAPGGAGNGRFLLHLGPGLRQAIDVDDIYLRRRSRGEDWELELDPPVNLVLPVVRDALPALWAAFGE